MRKFAWLLAFALVFAMMAPAMAAPLFPDVPAEHWGRDAVANLAAKGILEGYPDGTFKGDRAATRWEMAMCVARLLAKMEQEHATFATKADLEELQNLVNTLKEELNALGVRVGNLEDSVGKLDKRVTDLERIRFYGSLDSIFVGNGFKVTGDGQYQSTVGDALDLFSGRPYMVGSGLTLKGILGVRAKVSEDIAAGLELAGFVSTGDSFVDNFYGVSAPYLSNFFAQKTQVNADQNTTNTPWTRMNLENFWLRHNPSGLKLTVGTFDSLFTDVMYVGQLNPNVNGPKFLPSYGFQITGNTKLFSPMDYEVMYTYLPDGNAVFTHSSILPNCVYDSKAMGLDLKWNFDKGSVQVGLLRAENERRNGYVSDDVFAIRDEAGSFTMLLNWVNPQEYNADVTANNLDPNKQAVYLMGPANLHDRGNIWSQQEYFRVGPQGLSNIGLSADYNFEPVKVKLDLASTTYRPNTNSSYKKTGTALKFGLGATLVGGALDLYLDYLSVSQFYDPMLLQYPFRNNNTGAMINGTNKYFYRLPNFSYFPNLWQLHDSDVFPNNRQGIKFKADYKFAGEDGNVAIYFDSLSQVEASVPDIKYSVPADSLNIVGFSPGFIEPFFHEVAGNGGLGASYKALEENKGKITRFGIDVGYKFKGAGLRADLSYNNYAFKRNTDLNANTHASAVYQNYIDVKYNIGSLALAYPLNERFCLKGGYEYASLKGHHVVLGGMLSGMGGYVGTPTAANCQADNFNLIQSAPYLGFDYKLSKSTSWGLNLKFLSLNDKSTAGEYRLHSQEPFKWSGTQLFTEVNVAF
ncbi:MAG: S-layer homology domain-containing protein [Candidatus Eremiobacteraeota bacterium]|nr:S-layer homology domain-containing protein [Candidatus Eremiobacteraeota bacterium]